jgi:hypothetical protein
MSGATAPFSARMLCGGGGNAKISRAGPLHYSMCPGGEIGRRRGLKILFPETGVRVQVPPRAPKYLQTALRYSLSTRRTSSSAPHSRLAWKAISRYRVIWTARFTTSTSPANRGVRTTHPVDPIKCLHVGVQRNWNRSNSTRRRPNSRRPEPHQVTPHLALFYPAGITVGAFAGTICLLRGAQRIMVEVNKLRSIARQGSSHKRRQTSGTHRSRQMRPKSVESTSATSQTSTI